MARSNQNGVKKVPLLQKNTRFQNLMAMLGLLALVIGIGTGVKALLSSNTKASAEQSSQADPSKGRGATAIHDNNQSNIPLNINIQVWVNTKSGKYHCPDTRWFGKTIEGQYITQGEAQAK